MPMLKHDGSLTDFDFFVDEDVRSRRIGILCMEKHLTPALSQALFRIKENALTYHQQRIQMETGTSPAEKAEKIKLVNKQIREVKGSGLNLIRSFIAQNFLEQFFHYWAKGPLPIIFFNAPFTDNHVTSINGFLAKLKGLKLDGMSKMLFSQSALFLDSFTTPPGYKIEESIRNANNLSRCYRIDSRAHDLMQLCDTLLGVTTYIHEKKETSSRAKLNVVSAFKRYRETFNKKHSFSYESVYTL